MSKTPLLPRLLKVVSHEEYLAITTALCVTHDLIEAKAIDSEKWGPTCQAWVMRTYKNMGI